MIMSPKEYDKFIDWVTQEHPPTDKLREAFKSYRELFPEVPTEIAALTERLRVAEDALQSIKRHTENTGIPEATVMERVIDRIEAEAIAALAAIREG